MSSSSSSSAKLSSEELAIQLGLPIEIVDPTLVAYRSAGIGVFGAVMRWGGMPLEKIALYMNSSQVTGKHPFRQAIRLTFQDGMMTPYRVVGPASLTSWFLAYSVMGCAFQAVDRALSQMMNVQPAYYGKQLMEPSSSSQGDDDDATSLDYKIRVAAKTLLAPAISASVESTVSNRAEVQRYFGPAKFAEIEAALRPNALRRVVGPAFAPNMMRNMIMCHTSFVITPTTYKLFFPQEHKSQSSLFWYGLSMNIFMGNVVAITQQALWGRTLDTLARDGTINYSTIVRNGLAKEGWKAFFTGPKWFSRVLMNAPAQGTLPWFYNEVLPLAEPALLHNFRDFVYEPILSATSNKPDTVLHHHRHMTTVKLVRRRTDEPIGPLATSAMEPEVEIPSPLEQQQQQGERFTATSPRC